MYLSVGALLTCVSFTFAQYVMDTTVMQECLAKELGDVSIAKQLTDLLVEDVFTWKMPAPIAISEIKTIIAYAFGNRILLNGNREPGPVNEALADLIVRLYSETGAHVYAQWEIAEAIGNRIAPEHIIAIYPTVDERANVVYLSTTGVAQAVIKQVHGDAKSLGKVAVIGFNDHVRRCVEESRTAGMDAYMPEGYVMPSEYDQQSGQPWTRTRLIYLEHEIVGRITKRKAKLIEEANK